MGALVALALAAVAGCGGTSTGTIQATFRSSSGTPVGDTRVVLKPVDGGDALAATTNAEGRLTLADVEKGLYRVSLRYQIANVFECAVPYTVEVRAGKTLVRKLSVPVVNVQPGGKASLPKGKTTTCRPLRDPVQPYLCEAARYPISVYALPSRNGNSAAGYERIRSLRKPACRNAHIVGRASVGPGWGWLLVSLGHGLRGWLKPQFARSLSQQLSAWADVAQASVRKLPKRPPMLAGGGLPDLAFTTPQPSAHAGDPCDPSGINIVEWLFQVRNDGDGLAPKRVYVHVDNFGNEKDDLWVVGGGTWIRGLAPGEQADFTPAGSSYSSMSPYDRVTLDPGNKVKESNEDNNSLSLGPLPYLVCR